MNSGTRNEHITAEVRTAQILHSVDFGFGRLVCNETQVQRKIVVAQPQTISHIVRQLSRLPSGQAEEFAAAIDKEDEADGDEVCKGIVAAQIRSKSIRAVITRRTRYPDGIGGGV